MSTYIARQPILNKSQKIFGYELLYRQTPQSPRYDGLDGDKASSEIIMNSFHNVGIERVTSGKRAFINFTAKLIMDGVPTLLPNRVLVIEILDSVQPNEEIIKACAKLRAKGYMLALDDFIMEPEYMPFLQVADIVRVDFMNTPLNKIESFARIMKDKPIKLLAERLETKEDFDTALAMGFSLFQGYFFCKPSVIISAEADLSPLKVNCLSLIKYAFEPNVNFTKISDVIKHDVALSYRLLRVVNSAFFGLKYTVKNIRQALAILGMEEVKKWVTLMSLSQLSDDKPDELIRMSLIRAKFLELLAPMAGMMRDADDLFMLGLISMMDAIVDLSFDEIVKRTNVSANIVEPIVTGQGKYADLLKIIRNYERSEWDEAFDACKSARIDPEKISDVYLEAVQWADQM